MAVHLHNPELLHLPSRFLSEPDHEDANKSTALWEEQDLRYGSGSSEACSEETGDECDPEQDDYMAELTNQMARYMFQEDDKDNFANTQQQKGFSGSPNQALTDHQIRAVQFYKLKQEQSAKKPLQSSANWGKPNSINKEGAKTRTLANPWSNHTNPEPAQQQNFKLNQLQTNGSGMRAVFLGGSGSRRGSCGTGVFLPRGDCSNSSESRKKPGCSTVLIPARVAQALKLHFDKVGVVSRPNTNIDFQGKNHNRNENQNQKYRSPAAAKHLYEMRLPQEWTY